MTQRIIAHAPRARSVGDKVTKLDCCVGCSGCTGLCAALIDLLTVPDAVLGRRP